MVSFGIYVHVRSARPDFLFNGLNPMYFDKSAAITDVGARHGNGLLVDLKATKSALLQLMERRLDIIDAEVEFLRSQRIDLVIADIPFLAIEAATYAGIPVFAISNFEWKYVYQELFADDAMMRPLINTVFGLYQRVDRAFRLPFSSKQSMAGFRRVELVGLLARKKDSYRDVKQKHGIDGNMLMLMFGGEEGMDVDIDSVCKAYSGHVVSTHAHCKATNHVFIAPDADFMDYIHSADIILTKPGYSSFAEAIQFNKFIIYYPRKDYPEERVLIDGLQRYPHKMQLNRLDHDITGWKHVFENIQISNDKNKRYPNRNQDIAARLINSYLELKHPHADLISVIDAGTNNLNYALVDASAKRVIHSTHLTTGLGKNYKQTDSGIMLSTKSIAAFQKNFRTLMTFDAKIESRKQVIATGIARKAININRISEWIEARYQMPYNIISEQDECRYAYHAAQNMTGLCDDAMIIDIGGFSTEFVYMHQGKVSGQSLPIGLLSLKRVSGTDSCCVADIGDRLANLPETAECVFVGLTASLLAKVVRRQVGFDVSALHGQRIRKAELIGLMSFIDRNAHDQITPYLIDPASTDILRLSTDLVIQILDRFGLSDFIVCYYGISVGYALWKRKRSK